MKRLLFTICVAASSWLRADDAADGAKFFENEVRPILVKRCYECHGEKKQKGGLRVDGIAFLKAGGDTGPALVAGEPDKSSIIEAVRYQNADFQMPPKGGIPAEEVAVLERWVRIGAPWPQTAVQTAVVLDGGFTPEQRAYWFFQPLAKVAPPKVGSSWVRGDIDRFIIEKRREMGVEPAPEADRSELVRRVYFDLHGLPPSTQEEAQFAADPAPDAYERLVDRLLADEQHAVRYARHWLDVLRYADADERMTPELREEILAIARDAARKEVAYYCGRKNFFLGEWIRHAMPPGMIMRFFRPGHIRFERLVNPVPVIDGPHGYLRNFFEHYNFSKGLTEWFDKHNKYSLFEAMEGMKLREKPVGLGAILSRDPFERRRALKELSFRLPLRHSERRRASARSRPR